MGSVAGIITTNVYQIFQLAIIFSKYSEKQELKLTLLQVISPAQSPSALHFPVYQEDIHTS
jgi:hypothetical protein